MIFSGSMKGGGAWDMVWIPATGEAGPPGWPRRRFRGRYKITGTHSYARGGRHVITVTLIDQVDGSVLAATDGG